MRQSYVGRQFFIHLLSNSIRQILRLSISMNRGSERKSSSSGATAYVLAVSARPDICFSRQFNASSFDRRKRVKFFSTLQSNKTIIKSFYIREVSTKPMMGGRVIWFEFDSSVICLFRVIPVPFIIGKIESERGVCFRKLFLNLQRPQSRRLPEACCLLPEQHRNLKRERRFRWSLSIACR